jgi:hypothetical protein
LVELFFVRGLIEREKIQYQHMAKRKKLAFYFLLSFGCSLFKMKPWMGTWAGQEVCVCPGPSLKFHIIPVRPLAS